ncbi:hypothetical protein SAMN05877962_103185 [Alloalcanivorax xenomutans]|uniref:CmcJ/NvfI family oxidoreductase n=1 Tax=Alloalcanivorax xenomutans TaxID=1094342 RepID=UPI000BD598AF|nr:CmcJ/NvfI family oxidoreductase [Alloalcanivorax xenomutans]SOB97886.1 hypothetical protein SAMN05877962_103185 [Alloalcanivorax xenomutans]
MNHLSSSFARHEAATRAYLSFHVPGTERPCHYMYQPEDGSPQDSGQYETRAMTILDARHADFEPGLDRQGFRLLRTEVAVPDRVDDDAWISASYYPPMAEMARRATGADRALVFDHQVRRREPGQVTAGFGRHGDGSRPGAVGRLHNDYSEASGRARVAAVLARQGERMSPHSRYAIVNLWRPLRGPVLDAPLALCDASTLSVLDLNPAEVRYRERTGEIYLARYTARQRWYHYPAMTSDEVLIFKQYDTQLSGTARFTPHGAFDPPALPADVAPRHSIELRVLLIHH